MIDAKVKFKIIKNKQSTDIEEIVFYKHEINYSTPSKKICSRNKKELSHAIGGVDIEFNKKARETVEKLRLLGELSTDADEVVVYPKYDESYYCCSVDISYVEIADLKSQVTSDSENLSLSFAEISMQENIDGFPVSHVLIRNEKEDNTLSTEVGTEIVVTDMDYDNNIIILSYLPFLPSIYSPVVEKEWTLMNLELTDGPYDPSRRGDYTHNLLITGGDHKTKSLSFISKRGDKENWKVGNRVAFYNPFIGWEWSPMNPIISSGGNGWRDRYVTSGPVFRHSSGKWILFVNGYNKAEHKHEIGAFETSSLEDARWTVMNSDEPIFKSGKQLWRKDCIIASGSIMKLDESPQYIMFVSGLNKNDNKWRIGWVKFDENFENITYSTSECIDSSGASAGFIAPSVVKYRTGYKMLFISRENSNNPDKCPQGWLLKEAVCDSLTGEYLDISIIFEGRLENDGSYRSSHVDAIFAFEWQGKHYAFIAGTSRYLSSAKRGNRVYGLIYHDGDGWKEDHRSPVFINPIYGDEIWSDEYTWCQDHLGGYLCFTLNEAGNKIFMFFSANNGVDTYKNGYVTLGVSAIG